MKALKQRRAPAQRPGEILEAALALFVEKGFAATRLDDVAERAGLSKAAIYLYFADKLSAVIHGHHFAAYSLPSRTLPWD